MTRGPLSFSSRFTNNAVVIIDALGEADLQTASRLHDEVTLGVGGTRSNYCRYFKAESAAQFWKILEEVADQTKLGLRPIIHIEAHGEEHHGIQISASGESISWPQLLLTLQEINKRSQNNLGVVMAACFGLHAIKPLRIDEPCPFYFLIGADQEVSAGLIDDQMKLFYLALNRTNSLDDAMGKIDAKFKQFHSEKFFYLTFAKYMRRACMGAGAQQRVERLVTKIVEGGGAPNRTTLRALRKSAKVFVRSAEPAFERRSAHFLHGRKSVTYAELERFVRGAA